MKSLILCHLCLHDVFCLSFLSLFFMPLTLFWNAELKCKFPLAFAMQLITWSNSDFSLSPDNQRSAVINASHGFSPIVILCQFITHLSVFRNSFRLCPKFIIRSLCIHRSFLYLLKCQICQLNHRQTHHDSSDMHLIQGRIVLENQDRIVEIQSHNIE